MCIGVSVCACVCAVHNTNSINKVYDRSERKSALMRREKSLTLNRNAQLNGNATALQGVGWGRVGRGDHNHKWSSLIFDYTLMGGTPNNENELNSSLKLPKNYVNGGS